MRARELHLSLKERLENQAYTPLLVILIFSFVTRSAQTWSYGSFNLNMLPSTVRHLIEAITGLGIATSLEILSTAAGAKWIKAMQEEVTMRFNAALSRMEREAQANIIAVHKLTNLVSMIFGMVCSLAAGVSFAVTVTQNSSIGAIGTDLLITGAMTYCLFYFGVIYEPAKVDREKVALEHLEDQVHSLFGNIVDRVRSGNFSNNDIAVIQAQLPKHKQARLDALKVFDSTIETWDTARIAKALGKSDDVDGMRDIRRKIATAAKDLSLNVHKDGNKWVVPLTSVMLIFGTDIERLLVADNLRQRTNEYGNGSAENSRNGARQTGQTPDIERSMALPDTVPAI